MLEETRHEGDPQAGRQPSRSASVRAGDEHVVPSSTSPVIPGEALDEASVSLDASRGNGGSGRLAAAGDAAPDEPRWVTLSTRVGDVLALVLLWLGALCLAGSAVVVIIAIFYRYVLRAPFVSSGDLLTLAFTWLIFLGIPRSIWRRKAAKLGMTARYPERIRASARALGEGATLAFTATIVWSYISLLPSQRDILIPTLGIPQLFEGLAVAIGMGLTFLALLCRRVQDGLSRQVLLGLGLGVVVVIVLNAVALPPVAAVLIGVLGLILVDAPIAVALGVGGSAMVLGGQFDTNLPVPAGQLLVPTENLAFLAIPLFMLMGGIFARSRLAKDLSRFVRHVLGWLPGGVGVACVATSAIFANISGSAIADTAAIGTVYVPELIESGYLPEDAAAIQASAGVVGVVFPPAIAMILFATVANIDVIPVFKAVVIPGLILVAVMATIVVFHARRAGIPRVHSGGLRGLVRSLPSAVPVLMIPLILDGGIFSGIFTPAESGAVAILVALVFIIALRGFSMRQLSQAVEQALDNTALVMFILVAVSILDYGFITSGIGDAVTQMLGGIGSQLGVLLVINLIFIIIHEFVDAGPSILVMVPLVIPAALAVGISPLQLAAVVAINSTIGAVLPPIGVNLYVTSELAGVDPRNVITRVLPYVAGSFGVLVLVTLIPPISLWLTTH